MGVLKYQSNIPNLNPNQPCFLGNPAPNFNVFGFKHYKLSHDNSFLCEYRFGTTTIYKLGVRAPWSRKRPNLTHHFSVVSEVS